MNRNVEIVALVSILGCLLFPLVAAWPLVLATMYFGPLPIIGIFVQALFFAMAIGVLGILGFSIAIKLLESRRKQ